MKKTLHVVAAVALLTGMSAPAFAAMIAPEPTFSPARLLPMKDSGNTRTTRLLPDRGHTRQGDNLLPDRDHTRQGDK